MKMKNETSTLPLIEDNRYDNSQHSFHIIPFILGAEEWRRSCSPQRRQRRREKR